ncbi:hypothetical protein [Neisseria wadsworthii]|uniref:hypothetical protein n=1 Tax=Neisseria wadsworthii TaxID=607711 RepID=UPI0015F44E4B|nr:hypothetical protein [Neisseria wadsworthii]QMT34810.1 hypothetical protein H3L96_06910 [Neisseria wadsworthii]
MEMMMVSGRKFKSNAQALAMGSIARCLNNAPRVEVNAPKPQPLHWSQQLPMLPEHERTEVLAEKLLSRNQQIVLGGIIEMLKEMGNMAADINIQAGAYELPLPPLLMDDVRAYSGAIYRALEDAMLAADKLGQDKAADVLERARELRDFKKRVITLSDKRRQATGYFDKTKGFEHD